jgi:hypothetical protein
LVNQTLHALVKLVEAGQGGRSQSCGAAGVRAAMRELGLAKSGSLTGAPLNGGVSSDIWRLDTEQGPVGAKRALPRLGEP